LKNAYQLECILKNKIGKSLGGHQASSKIKQKDLLTTTRLSLENDPKDALQVLSVLWKKIGKMSGGRQTFFAILIEKHLGITRHSLQY
jgi:hypothetical protein